MSQPKRPRVGTITWTDLTVPDAGKVATFYREVVGWRSEPVSMGEYEDHSMLLPEGNEESVAGVCHARGVNQELPAQWLVYITVADLDRSLASCRELGGEVVSGPRSLGGAGRFAVIQDPAGAMAALIQPPAGE